MEGKRSEQDLVTAFLIEVSPPPGVEVQVYRRRQDDPEKWEYLETLEPEFQGGLDFLKAADRDELLDIIPFPGVQRRWGGGKYQFRFVWRDDEGRKEPKRSRNMRIDGHRIPKR